MTRGAAVQPQTGDVSQDAPASSGPVDTTKSMSGITDSAALNARAGEMWQQLGPQVSTVASEFMPAVKEFFSGGEGMDFAGLIEKLQGMWPQISEGIRGAGGTLAQKVVAFFMADGAEGEMGEGIGWLAGTIVFEIVLFYFTAGAGTAIVEGSRALKWILKVVDWTGEVLGAAFNMLSKVGGFIIDMAKGLAKAFSGAAKGAMGRVLGALGEIGEGLLKWADELVGTVKKADGAVDDVASQTKRASDGPAAKQADGMADDAAGQTSKRADSQTDDAARQGNRDNGDQTGKRAQDTPDMTEKLRVAALAKVTSDALERVGTPAPAIVKALSATYKPQYRWIKRFTVEYGRGGMGTIYMIASKIKVDELDTLPATGPRSVSQAELDRLGCSPREEDFIKKYRSHNPNSKMLNDELVEKYRSGHRMNSDGNMHFDQTSQSALKGKGYSVEEKQLIREYRTQRPSTGYTNDEIVEFHRQGMVYDPQTRRFKDPNVNAIPDTTATKTPLDNQGAAIPNGTHGQANPNLELRSDHIADRKALLAKADDTSLPRSVRDKAQEDADLLIAKINRQSEIIGEAASDAYAKKIGAKEIYTGHHSGTLDKVYKGADGKIIVVEAKGGASTLGSRKGADGLRHQQGTGTYLDSILSSMEKKGASNQEILDIVEKIRVAKDAGNMEYLLVQQPIKDGLLVPMKVSKFIL